MGPSVAQEALWHCVAGQHSLWGGILWGRELQHPRGVGQAPIFLTEAALVAPPGPCAWVALFNVTP